MSTQNENPDTERAWAFVHGQMADDARRDFEERMARDGALRALVGEIQDCDRELRRLAPFALMDDETLAKNVLASWEAAQVERGAGVGSALPGSTDLPLNAKRANPFRLNKPVRVALAFAMCCLVAVVTVRHMNPPPFVWETEIVQQAKYRGAGGEETLPRYTRSDMTELTSSLRASVEDEFRYMATKDKKTWPGWVLSTRIQELEAGRLAVQVQAFKSKGDKPVKEWLKNYADAQAFRSRVDDYGRQIVEDLAQLGHGSQDYIE